MIEFDDNGNKLEGTDAIKKRITNRLTTIRGEIPYFNMGIRPKLFTYEDPTVAIIAALSDLGLTGVRINDERTRVKYLNMVVDVKDTLERLK